jgi:hypothetical protein
MILLAERLENRTLFTAIPPAVAAAYAVLIKDDAALKVDMKKYTAALTKDVKSVAAILKTFGHSAADNAAIIRITKDVATTVSADSIVTSKYVGIANGIFHQTELAEAAFTAKPNLANGHKLVAQVNACDALERAFTDPRFEPGIQKASAAAVDLGNTISLLPPTHGTSMPLFSAVLAVNTDIGNLNDVQGDAGDAALADIPALLGTN